MSEDKSKEYTRQSYSMSTWLRKCLLIIILHSLIPLVLLIAYINLGAKHLLTLQVEETFVGLTKIASNQLKEQVKDADEVLSTLDGLDVFNQDNVKYCNSVVKKIISEGVFSLIGAADLNGNIYCISNPTTKKLNVADRLYFQEAKNNQAFSSGEFILGKIQGIPALTFGKPIFNEKNELVGISIASFTLDYLQKVVSGIKLPSEFNITIIDKNGTILARHPYNKEVVGKIDLNDQAIKKILNTKDEDGSFVLRDNPSGKPKIYAFSRIDTRIGQGEVYVYTDVPMTFITSVTDKKLATDSLLVTLTVALVIFIVIIDWHLFVDRKLAKLHRQDDIPQS
jgi:hypothetical protein